MPDGAKIILRKHTLYTKNLFTFQSASLRSSGPANLPTARDSRQTRMRLSAAGRTRQCRRRWHKTKRHPPRSWCPCQRPSAFTTDGQGQESAGRAQGERSGQRIKKRGKRACKPVCGKCTLRADATSCRPVVRQQLQPCQPDRQQEPPDRRREQRPSRRAPGAVVTAAVGRNKRGLHTRTFCHCRSTMRRCIGSPSRRWRRTCWDCRWQTWIPPYL